MGSELICNLSMADGCPDLCQGRGKFILKPNFGFPLHPSHPNTSYEPTEHLFEWAEFHGGDRVVRGNSEGGFYKGYLCRTTRSQLAQGTDILDFTFYPYEVGLVTETVGGFICPSTS